MGEHDRDPTLHRQPGQVVRGRVGPEGGVGGGAVRRPGGDHLPPAFERRRPPGEGTAENGLVGVDLGVGVGGPGVVPSFVHVGEGVVGRGLRLGDGAEQHERGLQRRLVLEPMERLEPVHRFGLGHGRRSLHSLADTLPSPAGSASERDGGRRGTPRVTSRPGANRGGRRTRSSGEPADDRPGRDESWSLSTTT